ncbi:hypothetical protein CERSUDRAFT_119114 [Gelatoporia subvermispora B]|uniref:F-box domain-containing protein n=1 Tax=Ceriporiopsis subvermispora (strain B) TaxID=914234 RepID=M2P9L1_CERS8|nr:hypothetical protein CERSUDRAFT_119114 [Gelatoporia subvermispora B]
MNDCPSTAIADTIHNLGALDQRCFSDTEVKDATFKTLENALATSLALVRQKLNRQLPINRLPHDILSTIFHCVPEPEKFPYPTPEWELYAPNCASVSRLTQVCTHWRDIAINTPTLWRRLGDALPVPTIRERACGTPLDLFVMERHVQQTKTLLSEGLPLRELHASSREIFPLLMKYPAPDLETLELSEFDLDRDSEETASAMLFQGSTPRLRELVLWRPHMLPGNSFSNLTRLFISRPNTEITLSKILTWLSASPTLEDFVLDFTELVIDQTELPVVHLGRLRTFVIDSITTAVAKALFDRITVSPTTLVQFCFLQDIVIPRAISSYDVTKVTIWQWEKTMRILAVGPSAGLMLETDKPDENEADNWYMDIIDTLPMGQIQELWVDYCVKPWMGSIRHLLSAMTGLKQLGCFFNHTSVSVLNALRTRDGEPPICPNLAKLCLQIGHADTVPNRQNLIAFLESRARIGCRISTLIMESYHDMEEMEGLRAMVDGLEYRTSLQSLTQMELPAVCTTKWHAYWRSWKDACWGS